MAKTKPRHTAVATADVAPRFKPTEEQEERLTAFELRWGRTVRVGRYMLAAEGMGYMGDAGLAFAIDDDFFGMMDKLDKKMEALK